jgi:hypothetical protein
MTTLRRKIIASVVTAGALSAGTLGLAAATHGAAAHEAPERAETSTVVHPNGGWKWRLSVMRGGAVRPLGGWKWRL